MRRVGRCTTRREFGQQVKKSSTRWKTSGLGGRLVGQSPVRTGSENGFKNIIGSVGFPNKFIVSSGGRRDCRAVGVDIKSASFAWRRGLVLV